MRKIHVYLFFLISLSGGYGFSFLMDKLFTRLLSFYPLGHGFWGSVFFLLCLWLYEDIQKQYKIRDEERAIVLNHKRKKKSVILKNHPLFTSSDDRFPIDGMDDLDRYFLSHEDEVVDMDWDETGHHIFKDHKYIQR